MKLNLLFLLVFIPLASSAQKAVNLSDKTYILDRYFAVYKTDTSYFYNRDFLNYSESTMQFVKLTFNNDGSGESRNVLGNRQLLTWQFFNNQLILDHDTLTLTKLDQTSFQLEGFVESVDSANHPVLVKVFSNLVEIDKASCVVNRTLRSGFWTDPGVWSCGVVPTLLQYVVIGKDHRLDLRENEMASYRAIKFNANSGVIIKHKAVLKMQ